MTQSQLAAQVQMAAVVWKSNGQAGGGAYVFSRTTLTAAQRAKIAEKLPEPVRDFKCVPDVVRAVGQEMLTGLAEGLETGQSHRPMTVHWKLG